MNWCMAQVLVSIASSSILHSISVSNIIGLRAMFLGINDSTSLGETPF